MTKLEACDIKFKASMVHLGAIQQFMNLQNGKPHTSYHDMPERKEFEEYIDSLVDE